MMMTMMMMMNAGTLVAALLLGTTVVSSFMVDPVYQRMSTRIYNSKAEHHLNEMPKVWENLMKEEKDIIVQANLKGTDGKVLTKQLAEKLLETALDYVHTKEQVEVEHGINAHQTYEDAIEEEELLEEFVHEEQLHDVPLDAYVEERLREAHKQEVQAKMEEEEAVRNFRELKIAEEGFKATLSELKNLLEP